MERTLRWLLQLAASAAAPESFLPHLVQPVLCSVISVLLASIPTLLVHQHVHFVTLASMLQLLEPFHAMIAQLVSILQVVVFQSAKGVVLANTLMQWVPILHQHVWIVLLASIPSSLATAQLSFIIHVTTVQLAGTQVLVQLILQHAPNVRWGNSPIDWVQAMFQHA
jgi:hypothetical protein